MLRYKIDVIAAIKAKGITTTAIQKAAGAEEVTILGQNALQKLREGKMVGTKSLDQICTILECQPSDIIEWIPNKKEG